MIELKFVQEFRLSRWRSSSDARGHARHQQDPSRISEARKKKKKKKRTREKTEMAEGGRGQLFVIHPYIKSSLSAAERINKLPRKARGRRLFHSSPFRPTLPRLQFITQGKRSSHSLFTYLYSVYLSFKVCDRTQRVKLFRVITIRTFTRAAVLFFFFFFLFRFVKNNLTYEISKRIACGKTIKIYKS